MGNVMIKEKVYKKTKCSVLHNKKKVRMKFPNDEITVHLNKGPVSAQTFSKSKLFSASRETYTLELQNDKWNEEQIEMHIYSCVFQYGLSRKQCFSICKL